MWFSCPLNAGQSYDLLIANKSYENVASFKIAFTKKLKTG